MSNTKQLSFTDESSVLFSEIPDEAIDYYLSIEPPLDKAGSYGIQGWIGHNYIDSIEGSYTNIMGLPTEKLFKRLLTF
jgi:septum formation protein